MSFRMMRGYISVFTLTAILSGCVGNQSIDTSPADFASSSSPVFLDSRNLSGRWLIQAIGNRTIDASNRLLIAFDGHSRVGGIAGCNRFLGAYMLGGEGELSLQELKVTRRICADPVMMQERLLLSRLGSVYSSRFTDDGRLLLFYDEHEKPISLARDPESLATNSGSASRKLGFTPQG